MPMTPTDQDQPRDWLMRAVRDVSVAHPGLWTLQVGERARVAHIFARLRSIVPRRWDVDSEWNRQGTAGEKKLLVSDAVKEQYGIPDLVIHHRGQVGADHNLLIAEFKLGSESLSAQSTDYEKVSSWMRTIGYRFGAVVSLGEETPSMKLMWRDGPNTVPPIESI